MLVLPMRLPCFLLRMNAGAAQESSLVLSATGVGAAQDSSTSVLSALSAPQVGFAQMSIDVGDRGVVGETIGGGAIDGGGVAGVDAGVVGDMLSDVDDGGGVGESIDVASDGGGVAGVDVGAVHVWIEWRSGCVSVGGGCAGAGVGVCCVGGSVSSVSL